MALRHDLSLSRRHGSMAPGHLHLFTPSMNKKGLQCTCEPALTSYIFSACPQQSLSNSPCMAVSVDKWTRAITKSSRLKWEMRSDPLRATIALPSALLKLPLRGAYFWSVLHSTQNVLRVHF